MIVADLHSALKPYLELTPKGQVFVLVDSNTATKCMPVLSEFIEDVAYHVIVIAAGEENKNLGTVEHIWSELVSHGATREALLLNLGGGVVTDLGGFAAATYMRGIRCVNIPTSLLAMVDASSGGKTGFDYKGVKNLIGTFTLPMETLIYLPFLHTLPADEWLSGYAEMLKHGLLDSMEHLNKLLSMDINDPKCTISSGLLLENLSVKGRVVEIDPMETGQRKMLNFGHTVGHAIEEAYMEDGKDVKHGYCVMWGMVAELYLSVVRLGFPKDILMQMSHLMLAYYGRPECKCSNRNRLVEWMLCDKKNREKGEVCFSLLRAVGDGVVNQVVAREELDEALEYLFSL